MVDFFKKYRQDKIVKRIIFIPLAFFCTFNIAFAESYDFYVYADCKNDADGSKGKPFCEISQAVEKAGKSKKIYIKDGEYEEDIDLQDGIEIFGESESGTIVKGTIEMDDDSAIENLTVTDANILVKVKKDADAEIDDCTIKGAKKVGIQTEIGGGKLEVKNSKIRDGSGKGLYIQAGKVIEITNNEIYENREEGIDLRADVSGEISNNSIYDNGESGIELIVGKSILNIKSNSIKNNGSSGIANQFYADWNKGGDISINSNTLSSNKKYGIDCNIPSGGVVSSAYWNDSIDLRKNKIEKNSLSSINSNCSLVRAIDDTEKKDNNISEINNAENSNQESLQSEQDTNSVEQNKESEMSEIDKKISNRLVEIQNNIPQEKEVAQASINSLKKEESWQRFLIGYNPRFMNEMVQYSLKLDKCVRELENFSEETGNPELLEKISEEKKKIQDDNKIISNSIREIKNEFSLFGWSRRLVYNIFFKK